MRLLEFEAKELFKEYGIPVPKGIFAHSKEEAIEAALEVGFPIVLKAQVPAGGRGKAGAIKVVYDAEELEKEAERILQIKIKGFKPYGLLVEEFASHSQEMYLGVTLSRPLRAMVAIASPEGGVDVEELTKKGAEVYIESIDPLIGILDFQARKIANGLFGKGDRARQAFSIIKSLYKMLVERDLQLVEINPLTVREEGQLLALDAKAVIDDNALGRQPTAMKSAERAYYVSKGEKLAEEVGFSYVPLEGDIAVIGNGAGLVMTTLDLVKYYGGKPACFIDVGGGASSDVLSTGIDLIVREVKPKVIFVNIFGGITRCDEVAKGLVDEIAKEDVLDSIRMIVRLTGTNEEEGEKILKSHDITPLKEMNEAAEYSVKLAGENR